jgi:chromosome segregation ATPase
MVQLQSANNQHENNAIPSQPLNMIPSIEDVSPPVCVDATVGRRGLEVHSHPSPPSPVPPGVASPQTQLWQGAFARLAADNEQLKAKCTDMESRLHQCNMVNRALEKQLEKQKEYWLEWQAQAEVYTHTISVLQDKLGACRTQLKQQDGMVEQLQADLQMSVGEIQFWKEQQVQEAGKFKKLCVEFEELQTNNERLESSQASLREELMSARRELGRTEAAAKASAAKEGGLKSTIQKLEDKIRHLEHVNNRLHGQATHYSLGSVYHSHRIFTLACS